MTLQKQDNKLGPAWATNAVFYHVYPLGLLGAESVNDQTMAVKHRLPALVPWLDHAKSLGCNAVYLGPVFESARHGYDTTDYCLVDRRLGGNEDLRDFVNAAHARGMRVILDAVFNHVGRAHPAFVDLQRNRESSRFRDWFVNVDFGRRSPAGDGFSYEGWAGHFDLVKLNAHNAEVRQMFLDTIRFWFDYFGIDGLRFDAADVIESGFLSLISQESRRLKSDCLLLGEVVHGDYNKWANETTLDTVTNYEAYKSLWSSHEDKNFFELSWTLQRMKENFGAIRLYNFADNHDVDRVASKLSRPEYLYTLYSLLFSIPGMPSLYYGSEFGLTGAKTGGSDAPLRPALELSATTHRFHPNLAVAIRRFAAVRARSDALKDGAYRELVVRSQQIAFERRNESGDTVVVAVNAAPEAAPLQLKGVAPGCYRDMLEPAYCLTTYGQNLDLSIPPGWARWLRREDP